MPSWQQRFLLWPLQAIGFWLFWLTAWLPIGVVSNAGGRLFGLIGPFLPSSSKIARNLRQACPDQPPAETSELIRGAWTSLGRVVAELPHLDQFKMGKGSASIEVAGEDHVAQHRDCGRPGIYFTGHLANWELAALTLVRLGLPLTVVYAPMKNPYIDRMLYRHRQSLGCGLAPKGMAGTRSLVQALRRGDSLGLVVDRKRKDGALTPFFGRDAWTTTAPARLALKFGCPLIPIRIERLRGTRFRATIYPPLEALPVDEEAAVLDLTRQMNAAIESWIAERPEQWWCNTNRWPKKAKRHSSGPIARTGSPHV